MEHEYLVFGLVALAVVILIIVFRSKSENCCDGKKRDYFYVEPNVVGAGDFHYNPDMVDDGSFTDVMADYQIGDGPI